MRSKSRTTVYSADLAHDCPYHRDGSLLALVFQFLPMEIGSQGVREHVSRSSFRLS